MMDLRKGNIEIIGHVHVQDDLGKVLLDEWNAVHPQNMATIIGRALSNAYEGNNPGSANQLVGNGHWIDKIVLGNGGASVGSTGAVTYLPPITNPAGASIYNETYQEIVDEAQGSDGVSGSANSVITASGSGTQTVVTVTADLAAEQPASQPTTDQAASSEDDFAFDELGLQAPDGLLLSHIIFSPILKSANRTITITYTLTITVS